MPSINKEPFFALLFPKEVRLGILTSYCCLLAAFKSLVHLWAKLGVKAESGTFSLQLLMIPLHWHLVMNDPIGMCGVK